MVAEGIESEAVTSELKALCCDSGQGFFLGRPMAPAAFTEWIRDPARLAPHLEASGYPQPARPARLAPGGWPPGQPSARCGAPCEPGLAAARWRSRSR